MIRWLLVGLFASAISKTCSQVLKKAIPDKLVVLTFDDAVKSHFTFVAPLLKKYGFGATFFVCEFPPDFGDTAKYMSWQQIQQLSNMGFEIGNHTRNHSDVDKLSKQKLTNELSYIEQKCISAGIPRPQSFAYPGYVTHPAALETLHERGYAFARIGGNRVYNPLKDHPVLIPGFTVLSTNRQEIMKAINDAKGGKITVLTFHGVPDDAHPWVTTSPGLFREYLQYLRDNKYIVISMKDLQEYINVPKALSEIEPVFPAQTIGRRKLAILIAGVTGCTLCLFAFARYRRRKGN